MQKKGVPEIQEYSNTQFYHEWFGLDFTGVGLPSLARRARVPVDSATLALTYFWSHQANLSKPL